MVALLTVTEADVVRSHYPVPKTTQSLLIAVLAVIFNYNVKGKTMSYRFDVQVLGVTIGTADGWDEMDIPNMQFYNFESAVSSIPSADCIVILYDTGKLETYDNDDQVTKTYDLLPILKSL